MNYRRFAGTIGLFALVASSVLTPGSAYAIGFTPPPGSEVPGQSTGGASRGSFFTPPPGSGGPKQSTGGASRGLFTPHKGQATPRQATGGASRNTLFQPARGRTAPKQAGAGASRGNLFKPAPSRRAPQRAAGGASRGDMFSAPGQGAPKHGAGGASREGTQFIDPSIVGAAGPAAMMAVLPQNFYGTTISERPSILVYLPASPAEKAVFSLKDESGNTVYQMSFPVSGEAGVLMVQPPANAPALEVGKNYQWFLALKVDEHLSPSTPYVDGWIQRIQPSAELTTALQQGDALQRAELLGKNGIWYDCAATLAMLRNGEPASEALNKHWVELMADIGLQEVNQAPVMISVN